jgi:hypothetical protein
MNTAKYFIAIGLAVLSIGCPVRSLFPLFLEKDSETLPRIVGTWLTGEGESYTFQKSGDKEYSVVWRDKKGETGVYQVQLGKLGKFWFMDSYPGTSASEYHWIASHIFSKIWLEGDSLRIASLEGDWLRKMIESGRLTTPHVMMNSDIVLTGSPQELQQLVLRFAEDDGAFPKSPGLVRMK